MFKRGLRLYVDTILVIYCQLWSSKLMTILPWLWLRLCHHTIIFYDDKQCYRIMLYFYYLIKNSMKLLLKFASFFFYRIWHVYVTVTMWSVLIILNIIMHYRQLSYKTYFYADNFFDYGLFIVLCMRIFFLSKSHLKIALML